MAEKKLRQLGQNAKWQQRGGQRRKSFLPTPCHCCFVSEPSFPPSHNPLQGFKGRVYTIVTKSFYTSKMNNNNMLISAL